MDRATQDVKVAVFIDFDNIRRSIEEQFEPSRVDIHRMLQAILDSTNGRIIVKRAYADWGYCRDYRSDLLDNATEPVQTFHLTQRGKNGADIRIAIDAMETALRHSEITHVAIVSGDSDFTPLVMKLRELGRHVIGLGVRANSSAYLAKACDGFIYYDDIVDRQWANPRAAAGASIVADPPRLIADAMDACGNVPVALRDLRVAVEAACPGFLESQFGCGTFAGFLSRYGREIRLVPDETAGFIVCPTTLSAAMGLTWAEAFEDLAKSLPQPLTFSPLAERYRTVLRDLNFRHVPYVDRKAVLDTLYSMFRSDNVDPMSLKEAKDRLHAWFEAERPSVPWESVNSTVYQLFYTWCFAFDNNEEADGKQRWDRRTSLHPEIVTIDDLAKRCDRGIVRRLMESEREDIDPAALNEWLYDADPGMLPQVRELMDLSRAPYMSLGR